MHCLCTMVFNMSVGLISYTPNPEILCARMASVSWRKKIPKNLSIEEAREIIKRVIGYGHVSVIEHASFTFFIDGVSRAFSHQLVRHRLASYTQQSLRYVNLSGKSSYHIEFPQRHGLILHDMYEEHMKKSKELYNHMIEQQVPPEDARLILPIGTQTKIAVTMNARELLHFFSLRCCSRAQWEIRRVANLMLKLVKEVAPTIFENAGPRCKQLGYCPEKDLKPEWCRQLE